MKSPLILIFASNLIQLTNLGYADCGDKYSPQSPNCSAGRLIEHDGWIEENAPKLKRVT
jgi:hypothetical protein